MITPQGLNVKPVSLARCIVRPVGIVSTVFRWLVTSVHKLDRSNFAARQETVPSVEIIVVV